MLLENNQRTDPRESKQEGIEINGIEPEETTEN